jgi:hypothetical protein
MGAVAAPLRGMDAVIVIGSLSIIICDRSDGAEASSRALHCTIVTTQRQSRIVFANLL